MFAYVKGILVFVSPAQVIIDVGGIGYKILIPASVYAHLPQTGQMATLYTSFVVREDAQLLYGFITPQERDFYEALLNVTGIGAKSALALIGHLPLHQLQRAIAEEDITAICRVPGIGKKGAERLIIEMRDKVEVAPPALEEYAVKGVSDRLLGDAMSALINLGYNQNTAQKALKKTLKESPKLNDLAVVISSALKHV